MFELIPNKTHKKWTFASLYSFCSRQNCADGGAPAAGMTYIGSATGMQYDGNSPLYGTTFGGGIGDAGVVFRLTFGAGIGAPTETVIYDFCSQPDCVDGANPEAAMIMDSSGNLYGTTENNVFELSPTESGYFETTLHDFCQLQNCIDGRLAIGTLTMDTTGNLFGTTVHGGEHDNGAVFEIVPNGMNSEETVLYSFCSQTDCGDGTSPHGGVLVASDGDLFGTTVGGGSSQQGVVFKLHKGTETVVHSFCAKMNCKDGFQPMAALISGTSGALFGTTYSGGRHGDGGTIFQLTP